MTLAKWFHPEYFSGSCRHAQRDASKVLWFGNWKFEAIPAVNEGLSQNQGISSNFTINVFLGELL